jgi:hypothetical protein
MEKTPIKITQNLAIYFKGLLADQQAINERVQRELGILAESNFKDIEPGKQLYFSDDFTEISLIDAPQPQKDEVHEPKKEVIKEVTKK